MVLEGKVWLTTATEDGHDYFVVCVDGNGKILLNEKLFHSDNPEPLGNDVNCYASPTPVVEPGRVYVNFGSYGTACLDTKTYENSGNAQTCNARPLIVARFFADSL